MKIDPRWAALGLLLAACDNAAPAPTDPNTVTFADVQPIFESKCGTCHVTDGLGGHNIGATDVDAAYTDSQKDATTANGITVGERALQRIQSGEMPQGAGCSGDPSADNANVACLTQAEQELIQAWIDAGQFAP